MQLPDFKLTASDFPDIQRFASHLPPVDEADLARLLRLIAGIAAVLSVAFCVVALNTGRILQAEFIVVGAFFFALLGRGYPPLNNTRLASVLAIGLTMLVSALVFISGEGIRTSAVLAYPGVLILASLTVSSVQFIAISIIILTTALGIGLLEYHHLHAVGFGPPLEGRHLFNMLLILTGTAIVARLLAHRLLTHLHRAHWQALIDPLTALPGRQALNIRAGSFLAEAHTAGCQASVIVIQVDRINHINRTFGHAFGDGALRKLADELRQLVGPDCLIVRHGGNTFMALLRSPRVGAVANALAQQILALTRKEQYVDHVAVRLDGTCGISIAAHDLQNPDALTEQAFIALYIALKQGGGNVRIYANEFSERARGDFLIESTLSAAIDAGRVVMHYQPILSQPEGRVIALEALLRLHSADGSLIATLSAIELAEASGLIHRLGEVILDSVLDDVRRWRKSGQSRLPVSVNFSSLQVSRADFAENLLARLTRYGLPGQALILEITETAAIDGDAQLTGTLTALGKAGILIALDDFGAGHSSLHRLREIPADIVKFDRSLIQQIGDSERARLFLRKAVELVRVAHPFILLEGIEDVAQVRHLPSTGCHAVQGYWYARPMPAADVPDYLAGQQVGDDLQHRLVYPA
jgi:diguanylate cyclase (GGDEF)-like protein